MGDFFQFHKMAKSLWDRLLFFYKQCLKTRKNGLFQMPALLVYKKMTSLKLAESGQFFFRANHRIPVCEPTTKHFWQNWLPVHVNMSWALGLKWFWMKQFFTVAVLFFCNKILLQISDLAHYNNTPLLNTIDVYKISLQD